MNIEFAEDTENGTESLLIDSCEIDQWQANDPPEWVSALKVRIAQRLEIARLT